MKRGNLRLYSICLIVICAILYIYLYEKGYSTKNTEGYEEKKLFHFVCKFHYGDNILNLKFFYNISSILKENNIMIHYYYDNNQIKNRVELDRYVDKETLRLDVLSNCPSNAVELWMGMDINGISHADFDVYFRHFYTQILQALHLEDKGIDVSLYQKEDYLLSIYSGLDDSFKNIDVLVLNSEPQSGQFLYNKDEMDQICKKLSKKYKIVTSSPVDETIPCTMRSGLAIQDIGAISTHTKYIVAVYSGPITGCFNQYSKEHIKKWIFLLRNPMKHIEIDNVLLDNVGPIEGIIDENMGQEPASDR